MLAIYIVCTIIIDSNKGKGGKLFEAFLVTVLANVISHLLFKVCKEKGLLKGQVSILRSPRQSQRVAVKAATPRGVSLSIRRGQDDYN